MKGRGRRKRDLKSRTGGPCGAVPVPLFRSMKRVPGVSTISTGPTLNPGGLPPLSPRLQRIKVSERWTPASRGNWESRRGRRSSASQKRDHLLGESATFIDHVFLKRELRYFRRICGEPALRNARKTPLAVELLYFTQQRLSDKRKTFDGMTKKFRSL